MVEQGFESTYIEFDGAVLIKADAKDSNIIYLQASNQAIDAQGDKVLQSALKAQVATYLKKGVISYDHLHKLEKNPAYIIGEPISVKFSGDNTLVKARLYGENEYAKGILTMAKSGSTRLGASIGGWIKKRIQSVDEMTKAAHSVITDLIWDETAITIKPINDLTIGGVTLTPYAEFCKSFAMGKALAAGYGTDSATMTGGRALVNQDLMGSTGRREDDSKRIQRVLKMIDSGKIRSHRDLDKVLEATDLAPLRGKIMAYTIQKIGK